MVMMRMMTVEKLNQLFFDYCSLLLTVVVFVVIVG